MSANICFGKFQKYSCLGWDVKAIEHSLPSRYFFCMAFNAPLTPSDEIILIETSKQTSDREQHVK